MISVARCSSLAALLAVVLAIPGRCPLRAQDRAPAQDAGTLPDPAPRDSDARTPPELLERAHAVYPTQARAQRLEASVVLRIRVEADGTVSEAEVLEPAGSGFDEAAREALLKSRFRPASKDGSPVAARILYRYAFVLGQAPPEARPEPPKPPEPAATSLPAAQSKPASGALEVSVRGRQSEAERLAQSAEAVTVVELDVASKRSSDMGEVLGRTFGVTVRRSGSLGTEARFSLNGLVGEQIGYFVEEIPLELLFPGSLADVPVSLIERVEIYRGVVPIRFGVDALGGLFNLVTDRSYETRGFASYQVGSFGTHRFTLRARYRHEDSGFFVGLEGFVDNADNDYESDVEVADGQGRLSQARLKRFHDRYFAYGVTPEVGFADVGWAKLLLVRPLLVAYDKQLQHNIVMSVPYGEVEYRERLVGGLLRYEVDLLPNLSLSVLGIYSHRTIDFEDSGEWVYDWHGNRVRQRRQAGEIEGDATDQTHWQKTFYGRANLAWQLVPAHALRLSATPERPTRSGDERIQADPSARDALTAKRDLFKLVSGLEYEANLLPTADAPAQGERRDPNKHYVLQNVLFGKAYVYALDSQEVLPGNVFRARDKSVSRFGIGDGLRVRLTPWAFAKASYEFATRLPKVWEVFGNGLLVQPNLEIEAEVSHNANLGARVDLSDLAVGDVMVDLNLFLRDTDRQIVLMSDSLHFMYQNVFRAITKGAEVGVEWVSPGRYATIDGNATYTDNRNASKTGPFAPFEGDRIPNRPWLMANWGASLRFATLLLDGDALEPFYVGHYVHDYLRAWESQGDPSSKQVVPEQITHGVGITYSVEGALGRLSATLEAQNFTDAVAYDVFAVQRPGRAYSFKVMGWL